MYTSKDSPCDFCQKRKFTHCIKINTQTRSSIPFIPLPAGFRNDADAARFIRSSMISSDSTCTSHAENVKPLFNLLVGSVEEHFYSSDTTIEPWKSGALRFALLAWAARQMPPSKFREVAAYCIYEAVSRLGSIMMRHSFEDSYIFAANLLGWIAYSTCSQEVDAPTHFNGSMAMLMYAIDPQRNQRKPVSDLVLTLGPFVIDCANAWTTRNGVVPHRCTKFDQRVKYFDMLRSVDNSGMWYSGILEAANSTLGNVLEVSLSCVCRIVKSEMVFDFSRDTVNAVFLYVRAEISDPDLGNALQAIDQSFQGDNTNHTTVEGQLITRLFHRARCILLLLTMLE